jgi:hypothetical protein
MPKRVKQHGLALVGVGVAVAVIAPAVIAQATDTDDFVQPASTLVQGSLKAGTKTVFKATVAGVTVIQRCTASSTSGTTPAHGLVSALNKVTFTGCTDNLGGKDTVTTTGVWHLTFHDVANDETATEPNSTGDKLTVTVPIKGATVTSTAAPGCTITVAPTVAAHTTGAYDDVSQLTITGAPVPISLSSGCPGGAATSTAHFFGTYILSPGVHDAS